MAGPGYKTWLAAACGGELPLRWYAISLLGLPLTFLICMTALYCRAPLRAMGHNWSLIFTAFLPASAIMILLNNVAEESAGLVLYSHVSKIVRPRSARRS